MAPPFDGEDPESKKLKELIEKSLKKQYPLHSYYGPKSIEEILRSSSPSSASSSPLSSGGPSSTSLSGGDVAAIIGVIAVALLLLLLIGYGIWRLISLVWG